MSFITILKEMEKETKINIVRYSIVIIIFFMLILYHSICKEISHSL